MKSQFIGTFKHPDGYNGNYAIARLVLFGNKLIAVYPFGFHQCAYLQMNIHDANEALWLINNHPNSRYIPIC